MAEHKIDFHEEIRIAQFWRRQLGEYEYVNHNPADLQRWYIALELRGPLEIRQYIEERSGRYPMTEVTGIVAIAPHPSLEIVQLWLSSHVKVRTAGYWMAVPAFLLFTYYFTVNLAGCQSLSPRSILATNPPKTGVLGQGGEGPPSSNATSPANVTPPANAASSGSQNGGH